MISAGVSPTSTALIVSSPATCAAGGRNQPTRFEGGGAGSGGESGAGPATLIS